MGRKRSTKAIMNRPELSLILPAYNEEDRIKGTLSSLVGFFDERVKGDYEILVVMDGCVDGTQEVVSDVAGRCGRVVPLVYPRRLGKGGAVIEALRRSRGDVLVIADADGSTPPEELYRLVEKMSHYDLCIGSRYCEDSRVLIKESLLRVILSRGFNALLRMMFRRMKGIRDTQCGAKAMKRKALEAVGKDLFVTDFAFDVNLIYSMLRHGFRVGEVGVKWRHEEWGSKVSKEVVSVAIKMIASIIKLRIYYSRFRRILDTRLAEKMTEIIYEKI